MKCTVDTNFIFDLDSKGLERGYAHRILRIFHGGRIELQVVAISASERGRAGIPRDNARQFFERLSRHGLDRATLLLPLAYYDVCYVDYCVMAGPGDVNLEREIHEVLFPRIDFDYAKHAARSRADANDRVNLKWLNAKCDVQMMWAHIRSGANVFLTRDKNFMKTTKKEKLEKMGAVRILTPQQLLRCI